MTLSMRTLTPPQTFEFTLYTDVEYVDLVDAVFLLMSLCTI
jgi:hypothetical protein